MSTPARSISLFASFTPWRAFRWAFVAGVLAAGAAPDLAAAQAARPGAFDGTWNVTFTPRAGNCHASNTLPFNVHGTKVGPAGGGKVSGGISRNGSVSVRISVGASY